MKTGGWETQIHPFSYPLRHRSGTNAAPALSNKLHREALVRAVDPDTAGLTS